VAPREAVLAVLGLDPRGRCEVDGEDGRVRATYGHSIDVEVDAEDPGPNPDVLYHGTPPRNLHAILDEGLRPMQRNEVPLSPDLATAREVGRRWDDPAVLRVDVDTLREAGSTSAAAPAQCTPARACRRARSPSSTPAARTRAADRTPATVRPTEQRLYVGNQ